MKDIKANSAISQLSQCLSQIAPTFIFSYLFRFFKCSHICNSEHDKEQLATAKPGDSGPGFGICGKHFEELANTLSPLQSVYPIIIEMANSSGALPDTALLLDTEGAITARNSFFSQ